VQRALKLGAKDGIGAVAIINDLIRHILNKRRYIKTI
jgi:hypothetical protein